jgi:hypothetical protein
MADAATYILIAVIHGWAQGAGGGSTGNAIYSMEFTSQANCDAARKWVNETAPKGAEDSTKVTCLEK